MKTYALLVAVACAYWLSATPAHADTYYWDVDGPSSAGFSTVVGTWNGTNVFWNTDSTGGNSGTTTATTTSADDLIIPQATTNTGTITVSGAQQASSITFAPNVGPTASLGGGTGNITIGGSGASSGIFQQSSGANTVSRPLILNSANTAFDISSSGAGRLTVSGSITGSASTGTQTVTVASSAGDIDLTGLISNGLNGGNVAVVLNGSAIDTTLNTGNDFSGGFTLSAGTISGIASGTYNGFGTGPLTLNSGTLSFSSGSPTTTIGNDIEWNAPVMQFIRPSNGTPTVNFDGAVTLGSNATLNVNNSTYNFNFVFNGNVGDGGDGYGLSYTGGNAAGGFTFNGTNTFTGDITIGGGAGSTKNKIVTVGGSGSLGSGNYSGNITIVNGNNSAFYYSSSADQVLSGDISGGASLVKDTSDTSTLTLTGNNTYAGNTTAAAGVLNTSKAAALPGYTTLGKVIVAGGTLGVQVGGAGWTTGQVDTLLSNATKTSGALGIDTTNGDLVQWTDFNTTNLGTALGLTKLGAGTLTLNGTNEYNGATTVAAGTLLVSGSLNTAGGLSVAAGATFESTGTITGNMSFATDAILSVENLSPSSITPFSVSGGNVTFAPGTVGNRFGINNLSGITWSTLLTGNYTLITGTVDGTNLDNLGAGNATSVGFGKTAYFEIGSLQLIVVPEPATLVIVASGLAALGLLRARRWK